MNLQIWWKLKQFLLRWLWFSLKVKGKVTCCEWGDGRKERSPWFHNWKDCRFKTFLDRMRERELAGYHCRTSSQCQEPICRCSHAFISIPNCPVVRFFITSTQQPRWMLGKDRCQIHPELGPASWVWWKEDEAREIRITGSRIVGMTGHDI